jgi:hypothetical protein
LAGFVAALALNLASASQSICRGCVISSYIPTSGVFVHAKQQPAFHRPRWCCSRLSGAHNRRV